MELSESPTIFEEVGWIETESYWRFSNESQKSISGERCNYEAVS
jgi:hypothetical protein